MIIIFSIVIVSLKHMFGIFRRESWIQFADDPKLANLSPGVLQNRRLCAAHFAKSAFNRKYKLRKDATPTVHTGKAFFHTKENKDRPG